MKHSTNNFFFLVFAFVVGLLAATTAQAQEPVPTPIPIAPTVTDTYAGLQPQC